MCQNCALYQPAGGSDRGSILVGLGSPLQKEWSNPTIFMLPSSSMTTKQIPLSSLTVSPSISAQLEGLRKKL